jgi:hypothetical protein
MNRLRWWQIRLIEALGWAGIAAGFVFAGCVALYALTLRPLHNELRDRRVVVSTPKMAADAPQGATPAGELVTFQALFKSASLEERLATIQEAGKTSGVALKRIEYRMLEEKRATLFQYQIVMPVKSTYPQIRRFISLVQTEVPSISLDQVAFQRKKIADSSVEAELRFTLFLENPV